MAQRSDGTMEQKPQDGTPPTPDVCPHCNSKEIDAQGRCQVCGHRTDEGTSVPMPAPEAEQGGAAGSIEVEFSTPSRGQEAEIPEWRHELSRRLLEIKRKREETLPESSPPVAKTLLFPHADQAPRVNVQPAADAPLKHARSPVIPVPGIQDRIVRLPEREGSRPQRAVKKPEAALPLFQPARLKGGAQKASGEAGAKPVPKVTDPDPAALQRLLDSIVLRQALSSSPAPPTPESGEKLTEKGGDRLILVSRALSGFVDLSIVVLLTGGIILSADFFSGIEMIDNVSKIWYSALLLATYMLYSTFFLGTANQTIGMMIKDLKVVGDGGKRPKMRQILLLSTTYVLSLLCAGLGLLWACFDRESRCLHDRLSHLKVVRL